MTAIILAIATWCNGSVGDHYSDPAVNQNIRDCKIQLLRCAIKDKSRDSVLADCIVERNK